jgi:hypothetical protein
MRQPSVRCDVAFLSLSLFFVSHHATLSSHTKQDNDYDNKETLRRLQTCARICISSLHHHHHQVTDMSASALSSSSSSAPFDDTTISAVGIKIPTTQCWFVGRPIFYGSWSMLHEIVRLDNDGNAVDTSSLVVQVARAMSMSDKNQRSVSSFVLESERAKGDFPRAVHGLWGEQSPPRYGKSYYRNVNGKLKVFSCASDE